VAMSERRKRAALAGRAAAGVLRASDPHGSARGVPAEVPRGSGGSGDHRRRGITRAGHLTGGGSRSNSGHCQRRNREWRHRGVAWHRGEAAAGLGRSWGAAERPVHGEAGSSARRGERAVVLGFGGGRSS
jgi:hypothetical protein